NFLRWRHEADRLGVRLANDDVNQMIADETRGEFTPEAAAEIDKTLRQRLKGGGTGFSAEALYAALGDELRVRIAQLALTGTAVGSGRHTLSAVPSTLTPQ